jgi:nitrous oxidase accessory protein
MKRLLAILAASAAAAGAQPAHQAPPAEAPPAARLPAAEPRNTGVIGRMISAAKDGDTIRVGPGVYREHIRIDRSITLIAESGAVIDGGGSGDIVEITAPGVTLRGFTVRNTGIDLERENAGIRALAPRATIEGNTLEDILFGIDLRGAPASTVRNNTIGGKDLDIARRGDGLRLWQSDDSLIEGNSIHDGRDAIIWYSRGVTVRANTSSRCRYGLHLMFSDSVVLEDNELSGNSVGIYLMYSAAVEIRRNRLLRNRGPSGYGIGLKETDRFTIADNAIIGNRVGVYLDGSPFTTAKPGEFTRNTLACNDIGITFLPSVRGNLLWDNNFIDNIEQVCISGRGELKGNQFWKEDRGNFWSDYTGYDQDRDGVGDFVHESQTLFESLMDREPKLRLLLFSPAQSAIELVGRAVPAVRPQPKFIDEVPLMAPVATRIAPAPRPSRAGLAAVGAGLLGLGAGLLLVAGTVHRTPRQGGAR